MINTLKMNLKNIRISTLLRTGTDALIYNGFINEKKIIVKLNKNKLNWINETESLKRLNHKNIIKMETEAYPNVKQSEIMKIKGKLNNDKIFWLLTQEYAEKGDLYDLLFEHKYFEENICKAFMYPIIKALNYAYYEKSISHRDIKLENIFIMNDWTVKLGDWGLASLDSKNRKSDSTCGTRNYASPQIIERKPYSPDKNDVWSSGVLLFSIITGAQPYSINEKASMKSKVYYNLIKKKEWDKFWLYHEFSLKDENIFISDDCKDLIEKMLDYNEDQRISLKEVLNHKWMKDQINSNSILKEYFF